MTSSKFIIIKKKFIHISLTKLNLICGKIRNKTYIEALNILKLLPQKNVIVVWQILHSVVTNAIINKNMKKNDLFIESIYVNKGPIKKKISARAKGKSDIIKKRMSHLTIKIIEKI
jgi:large subunit ribosomal protein L22